MRLTAQAVGIKETAPCEQIEALRVLTLTELDNARRQAVTLYGWLGVFENGGTVADMMAHLYPAEELARIREITAKGQTMSDEEAEEINFLTALKAHAQTKGVAYNDNQ